MRRGVDCEDEVEDEEEEEEMCLLPAPPRPVRIYVGAIVFVVFSCGGLCKSVGLFVGWLV